MAIDARAQIRVEPSFADRLSYAAARAGQATGAFKFHRYVLVAVPVSAMPEMPPRGWEARVLRDAAPARLVSPQAAHWRLSQGMDCIVAAPIDGEVVGVSWIGAGDFDEDEAYLRFVPPAGAGWDTGLYVEPQARAGRAFAALWAGTRAWAESRGLAWSMSRIADYNLASRRAHARMQGREVGWVSILSRGRAHRVWGADRPRASDGEPRPVVRPRLP